MSSLFRLFSPFVALAFVALPACALGDPLPDAMLAKVLKGAPAVLSTGTDVNSPSCFIWFDTQARKIFTSWHFASGELGGHLEESYDLSYEPTAICPKAGLGADFFIAGYSERTGSVIVEQWTFQDIAVGQSAPPGGGSGTVVLTKNLRKEILFSGTTMLPIREAVFNVPTSRLWLVEEFQTHVVWSIDPNSTAAPMALFDSTTVPQLHTYLSARIFRVKSHAPDGGGYLLILFPWRSWASKFAGGFPDLTTTIFVMRDANLDGIFEESGEMDLSTFFDTKHYFDFMDPYYH